jgi:hypothetical protein
VIPSGAGIEGEPTIVAWPRPGRGVPAKIVFILLALGVAISGLWVTGFLTPKTSVALDVAATLAGRVLTIAGTTDLPDGTVISVEVCHAQADPNLANSDLRWIVDAQVPVSGGKFKVDQDLAGWPPGNITIWTAFEPGQDQPASVQATFGDEGARLGGAGFYEDSDGYHRRVEEMELTLP